MEISRALTTDLDLLTDALNDPAVDLVDTLQRLADDTLAAVPSFLGLSLTVTGGTAPITYTALPATAREAIATSIMLPLLHAGDDHGRAVSLVLYAGRAGAFVDLAADLSWLTGIGTFTLDEHLTAPVGDAALGTLRAESTVNQAVGLLLARGLTPKDAERHLDALAADAGTTRHQAATALLLTAGAATTDPIVD